MAEVKTPEDLREHYEECGKYQNAHVILCRQLIERIAALEAENARLKQRSLTCICCGLGFSRFDGIREHLSGCAKHPLIQERDELKAQVEQLEEMLRLAQKDKDFMQHSLREGQDERARLMAPVSDGSARIAAERKRQTEVEGWTPNHDADHTRGELADAAVSYAAQAIGLINGRPLFHNAPRNWPWDLKWWNPSSDPIRNLEKAGALIAAEIDRIAARAKEQK